MKRRLLGALFALMAITMSIGMVGTAAAAQLYHPAATAPGSFTYGGNAYGTSVNVGNTILSGKTSAIGFPCAAPPGYTASANLAGVNVAKLLTTGAIVTKVTAGPANSPSASSSATVASVRLLSGLVSAGTVKAVSTTIHTASGYHVSAAGSSLTGLTVAGLPIFLTPAPNTTINLPGVGKVVLNEQIPGASSLTVNMIHVYVTLGLPGVPAGTEIIVGHAYSSLAPRTTALLAEDAFSAYAHIGGSLLTSGPDFLVGVCGSTDGKLRTNSGASVNIPGILSSGTATNTVIGTVSATTASGEATATIQNVKLLGGLITASAIKADAHVSLAGGKVSASAGGSTFGNLVVNGRAFPLNVSPNTKITIGNLTVWLNREIPSANGIVVRMIEITVGGTNTFGLSTGTDIQVASAQTYAYPLS